MDTLTRGAHPSPTTAIPFVEAFDVPNAITNVWNDTITVEGKNGRGWKEVHSDQHWSTVYWYSDREVPLVSNNSAALLARKSGSPLTPSAGILMVKVPSGWTAEFSGRAERPLIFDQRNQLVADGETEGDRYFTYINAAPGAHLVYVNPGAGQDGGALATPVFSGRTTYVDATQVSRRTLTGTVLDASTDPAPGIAKVDVKIVGQAQTATTTASGAFEMDGVLVFSDHSTFVETDFAHGFTHRYELTPQQLSGAELFRLRENQIQDSIGQLEGGVSPESGLIVGALTTQVARAGEKSLAISTRTLAIDPTLQPETYILEGNGQLEPSHMLRPDASRFISLQIPEGPAITEVQDAEHHVIWSELLVVSPGVVDVVMDPH